MNPQCNPIRKAIRFFEYPLFSTHRQTKNHKKEEKVKKSWLETAKIAKKNKKFHFADGGKGFCEHF